MIEYIIGCPRCGGDVVVRDSRDELSLCSFCRAELISKYDYQLTWQQAYEREKDYNLYRKIQHDPNYVAHVMDNYERAARDVANGVFVPDDPEAFLQRLAASKAEFEARWSRVQKLIDKGRAWLL